MMRFVIGVEVTLFWLLYMLVAQFTFDELFTYNIIVGFFTLSLACLTQVFSKFHGVTPVAVGLTFGHIFILGLISTGLISPLQQNGLIILVIMGIVPCVASLFKQP